MAKSAPLVSIIVPVYKTEKFLNRCVESLVNQNLKEIEIILVDDGSPDCCPQMCDEWAGKDSRIKVIHKENGGVNTAVIIGVGAATAEHIGFVDSDDWVSETMFADLYEAMIHHQADCVRCGIRFVDRNGREKLMQSDKEVVYHGDEIEQLILTPFWEETLSLCDHWSNSRCDKLYKKTMLLKILPALSQQLAMGEDEELNLCYLPLCNTIVTLKGCADYCYYTNMASVTKSFDDKLLAKYEAMGEALHRLAYKQKRAGKAFEKYDEQWLFYALYQVFTIDGMTLAQRAQAIQLILSRLKNRAVILRSVDKANLAVYRGMQLIAKGRVKTAVYIYAALVQGVHKMKHFLKGRKQRV